MITAFAFYFFAAVLIAAATVVVTTRNPVMSVLFLIMCFFNAAGLFLLAGAEFLAMVLVIVYVGAVAVLFLFVVMMLDIKVAAIQTGFQRYAPVGLAVGAVLLAELALVLGAWKFGDASASLRAVPRDVALDNTAQLGAVLYTDYILLFQASGLVLLVAMIGAIVLTHREGGGSRRQSIERQIARMPADTLVMVDVPRGAGLATLPTIHPLPAEAAPEADAAPHDKAHSGGH